MFILIGRIVVWKVNYVYGEFSVEVERGKRGKYGEFFFMFLEIDM